MTEAVRVSWKGRRMKDTAALRPARKKDFLEDLELTIVELVRHRHTQPREIRRFVNAALKSASNNVSLNGPKSAPKRLGGVR
jgi:hypothetical protein